MNSLILKIIQKYIQTPFALKALLISALGLGVLFIIPELIGHFIHPGLAITSSTNIISNWIVGLFLIIGSVIAMIVALIIVASVIEMIIHIIQFIQKCVKKADQLLIKKVIKIKEQKTNILR